MLYGEEKTTDYVFFWNGSIKQKAFLGADNLHASEECASMTFQLYLFRKKKEENYGPC